MESPVPKKSKSVTSANMVMAIVSWDAKDVIHEHFPE
jgi:hypothetical protein